MIGSKIMGVLKWLIKPWIKIRVKDAIGMDKVARKCYLYIGTLWEWHWFGYWQDWYDGPIHHISFGPGSIFWMHDIEPSAKDKS